MLSIGVHKIPIQVTTQEPVLGEKPATKTPVAKSTAKPDMPKSNQIGQVSLEAKSTRVYEDMLWKQPVQKSLIWRLIGAAEGCVSADGQPTGNYNGHVDPGNGVWNRGAFSYQFGNGENLTPQQADDRQAAKIKTFYDKLIVKYADKYDFRVIINALDLVNQAPLTVGRVSGANADGNGSGSVIESAGGFFQRYDEAIAAGKKGYDAVLNARVESFKNPQTGNYDTTFVSVYWLTKDQDRRMRMIEQAVESWNKGVRPESFDEAFIALPESTVKPPHSNVINERAPRVTSTAAQFYLEVTYNLRQQ